LGRFRGDCHERRFVHRTVLVWDLHRNRYQRSRFNEISRGRGYSVATDSSVDFILARRGEPLSTAAQKQFTASVSGSSNAAISWAASGGTVTSGGLYTAPSSAGTYTVTATSTADSTKSASPVVTVSQPAQVSVSLSPGAVSLPSAGQQQFTAYVSGTSNTAVSWSASAGSVTAGGLYIAPSAAGTYAIKAVSTADPTQSASATVSVSAPQAVSVSISPTTRYA